MANVPKDHPVQRIADTVGGRIDAFVDRGDGSGFATMSYPLPHDHWIYRHSHPRDYEAPPMPFRMGTADPVYRAAHEAATAAARYAIRATTMNGREEDWSPDALVQNILVGLFGYHTADGLSADIWANPKQYTPWLKVVATTPWTPQGDSIWARLLRLWRRR